MSQDSLACLPDRFNKLHSRIFKMSRLTRRFTEGFSLPAAVPGIFYGNSSSQSSGISSSEFQLSSHMDYSKDLCNIIQPYKTIIINATRGSPASFAYFRVQLTTSSLQLQHPLGIWQDPRASPNELKHQPSHLSANTCCLQGHAWCKGRRAIRRSEPRGIWLSKTIFCSYMDIPKKISCRILKRICISPAASCN